eukprot:m.69692 g.69692  ORF g.69692 m.69692 type:complete len:114 (+) comp13749_c0_seq1:198-539(+)
MADTDANAKRTADPAALPQKRYYRQRAHANPLSDHSFDDPIRPQDVNWAEHFPIVAEHPEKKVEFVDIGCGYGGLLGPYTKACIHPYISENMYTCTHLHIFSLLLARLILTCS